MSFLVLIALAYLLKISADFSRGWLLTWLALVSISLLMSRPASARLLRWLASSGYTARRIAVVASGATGLRLAEKLRQTAGVRIVGVFDEISRDGQDKPRAGIADLISIGQRNQIDEVVVALSSAPQPQTARLIDELSVLPIDVWLCPAEFDKPIRWSARGRMPWPTTSSIASGWSATPIALRQAGHDRLGADYGFRGPTEDPEKMRKRVQMDLYYIENWSISLDLKIIALTPFVGFVHRNAF